MRKLVKIVSSVVVALSFASLGAQTVNADTVAGNLTDRISKYTLTFIGGVLSLIGILGYVFSPNPNLLLLFRLINGSGFVLCTVCMATWLHLFLLTSIR